MHELPSNIVLLYRCKRMHPLLAASVNIMHFSQYLEEQGPIPDALLRDMKHLNEDPSADFLRALEGSQVYKSFMSQYMSYRQETLNESHGSTAQFWLTFVNVVHVFCSIVPVAPTTLSFLYMLLISWLTSSLPQIGQTIQDGWCCMFSDSWTLTTHTQGSGMYLKEVL